MELLGRIRRRKIFYLQIRNNPSWNSTLTDGDWIAFTVANEEDEERIPPAVRACLEKNVVYTCSAGELGHRTEDYFDEEISWRAVQFNRQTGKEPDDKMYPVTTAHLDFEEGFWFASVVANVDDFEIDKVVCLDFTKRKVKQQLCDLIEKINNGWLPS